MFPLGSSAMPPGPSSPGVGAFNGGDRWLVEKPGASQRWIDCYVCRCREPPGRALHSNLLRRYSSLQCSATRSVTSIPTPIVTAGALSPRNPTRSRKSDKTDGDAALAEIIAAKHRACQLRPGDFLAAAAVGARAGAADSRRGVGKVPSRDG